MKIVNRNIINSNKNNYKAAFQTELLRIRLAENNNLKTLENTYNNFFPEIPDLNTPRLWNKLNNRNFINQSSNPMAWDRLNKVVSIIEDDQKEVLDIGFGTGDLEKLIRKKSTKNYLTGIDISIKSVKKVQSMFPEWKFVVGKIERLPFPDEYFDYVIALEVLEHIKPTKTFIALKEVYRVLKPAGKVIISVPINEGLEKLLNEGQNPNAHVRTYTKNLLSAELSVSGFRVNRILSLYAFRNLYIIKTIICKLINGIKKPNNLIFIASKP